MSQRLRGLTSWVRADLLEETTRLIETGQVTPVVGRTHTLADAPEAIRGLAPARSTRKIVHRLGLPSG